MRVGRERRRVGLFVAEGPREVGRALAAGLTVTAMYHAPELLPDWPHGGVEVTGRVLAKMSYRAEPEGVLAIVETPVAAVPADATLVLVAVGIEKPGNLGALARSADAAGADALVVADAATDPWNPNAIRASTGAVFTLPDCGSDARRGSRPAAAEGRRGRRRADDATPTPIYEPRRRCSSAPRTPAWTSAGARSPTSKSRSRCTRAASTA